MTTTWRMLAPLRPAARFLTGSTYALLGFDALREPGARVDLAAGVLAAVRTKIPLPADEVVVRGNAAVQVLAGTSLALGLAPRLSALALAGSLVPTTLAGHAYWTIEDPAARKMQRIHFHKNMAMIGGLLFAALDQPKTGPASWGRDSGLRDACYRSYVPGTLQPDEPSGWSRVQERR